jgi:hypothetical protein
MRFPARPPSGSALLVALPVSNDAAEPDSLVLSDPHGPAIRPNHLSRGYVCFSASVRRGRCTSQHALKHGGDHEASCIWSRDLIPMRPVEIAWVDGSWLWPSLAS